MSGGFHVAPESFPTAANRLRDVAQGVLDAWGPVREQTAAIRYGRGDDLLSPLIQVSLASAVRLIETSVSTTAQHLDQAASGLELMGLQYQQADADVEQSLTAIGGSGPGGPASAGPASSGSGSGSVGPGSVGPASGSSGIR